MLNFLFSNCTWANGQLNANFNQPFDSLAETAILADRAKASQTDESGRFEKWLPFVNAYRTLCQAPSAEFRAILQEIGLVTQDSYSQ